MARAAHHTCLRSELLLLLHGQRFPQPVLLLLLLYALAQQLLLRELPLVVAREVVASTAQVECLKTNSDKRQHTAAKTAICSALTTTVEYNKWPTQVQT